jgi:hypothetical protein
MKKMLVLSAALGLVASFASAAPACTSETLNNYLAAGFSCTIDNLLFSNFTYTDTAIPSSAAIPATAVFVAPITTALDEGLTFNANWSVSSGQEEDSTIKFSVSTVNHADTIDKLSLVFDGSYTGNGTSGVTEAYCKGGTLTSCPTAEGEISVTNPPLVLSDTTQVFTGVNTLSVSKDISVDALTGGTAKISDVENTYGQMGTVPEPATMGLIGGGLLALGFLRKRS